MELRQLRYFVRIVELGGMGRAALEFGVATAALSQQINRLERELGVSLLSRQSKGAVPTEAGSAFYRKAQLVLRHADDAIGAARRPTLTGRVSIGLTQATAGILGGPLYRAMQERYPEVRLHLVEAFSGFLLTMLEARQLDLAILFRPPVANDAKAAPLLKERLFAICSPAATHAFSGANLKLEELAGIPLILPSRAHGLRVLLDTAFSQHGLTPLIAAEVDSLGMLLEAVRLGYGATIQQSAVAARPPVAGLSFAQISDAGMRLQNFLVSLPQDELSPAAAGACEAIRDVATNMVNRRQWIGASLSDP
ncbi:LysR family transcriptional regulator [Bordetella petrii]|nr:LysR family transcriptional regulator [Bordetella petrii]